MYLRLLIFLLGVLIPACASSSLVFHIMYPAYKLNICVYIYVYKNFSTLLDKGYRKNIRKKWRNGEVGKHKLNEKENTECEIEKVKQTR